MPFNKTTVLGRIGCSAMLCALISPAPAATLKKIAVIDLPGPSGKRFDYLSIDYEDRVHAPEQDAGARPIARIIVYDSAMEQPPAKPAAR